MNLSEDKLLKLVYKNFGGTLSSLEDTADLPHAWQLVEMLAEKGWRIDIMLGQELINVDDLKFHKGPGTIFAQYGPRPNFSSTMEGICKTALIALQTTEELQTL